jgi:hypothetical protein
MGIPITANIIHTIKHTVKDKVLIPTTDHAFVFSVGIYILPKVIPHLTPSRARLFNLAWDAAIMYRYKCLFLDMGQIS